LTASVKNLSNISGTPTGSVTFLDGTTILGTVTLRRSKAKLRAANLPVGQDPIQAVYQGNPGFAPSTSATVIETIRAGRAKTKVVISQGLPRSEQAALLTAMPGQAGAGATIAPGIGTIPASSTVLGMVPLTDDLQTSASDLSEHAHLVEDRRRDGHPRKAVRPG
jgi:hypothetical protein